MLMESKVAAPCPICGETPMFRGVYNNTLGQLQCPNHRFLKATGATLDELHRNWEEEISWYVKEHPELNGNS